MRIAFGKKLRGIQRAPLLDNAVHEEMILAPEQDDVPAAYIFNRDLPDQRDILGPHPGLHAGAVNAQGNPATPLHGISTSQRIFSAPSPPVPIAFLPLVYSLLHHASLLNFDVLRHISR